MNVDLSLLHVGNVSEIDISGVYSLSADYYQDTDILSLSDLLVKGRITEKENEEGQYADYISCTIKGKMILPDSISLEEVEYPFEIKYEDFLEENTEKSENTLDILAFLWENTVLEVPLQFTKVRDLSKFHGDGWKLIQEEELHQEKNPFHDLLKDFEKE